MAISVTPTAEQQAAAEALAAAGAPARAEAAAGATAAILADFGAAPAASDEADTEVSEQPLSTADDLPQPVDTTTDDDDEDAFAAYSFVEVDDEDDEDEPGTAILPDDDEEEAGYQDPDELASALRKLQKENAFLKQQNVQAKTQQWKARFEKKYPLASFDTITATSRRSFERAAIDSHNRNYKALEPHIETLRKEREKLLTQARQEGRAVAEQAWGKPLVGPDTTTVDASQAAAEIAAEREKAKRSGDLSGIFKTLIRQGK